MPVSPDGRKGIRASVIICAYSDERWLQLIEAIASVQDQSFPPIELIVCIDHTTSLLGRFESHLRERPVGAVPVQLVPNIHDGHLGSARNSAVTHARGDVIAFLDDDAVADADWLRSLVAPYEDRNVAAVGGCPSPDFESQRPRWFPAEFDWVFGCAYVGLPTTRGPVAHMIGANMSVRRAVLDQVGGFHSDNHDDMDLSHRVAHLCGGSSVLYEPEAIVRHFVPTQRTTWTYFWRRCFFVNRGKVEAFESLGNAAGLAAETAFVRNAVFSSIPRHLGQVTRGDPWCLARAVAIAVGIALSGLGHLLGQIELHLGRRGVTNPEGGSGQR